MKRNELETHRPRILAIDTGGTMTDTFMVDEEGRFDLAGTPYLARLPEFRFVSGSSTHADRLETIRRVWRDHGRMIDTHTADGLKVGLEHRECLLDQRQGVGFALRAERDGHRTETDRLLRRRRN